MKSIGKIYLNESTSEIEFNRPLARFILETDDPSGRTWARKR